MNLVALKETFLQETQELHGIAEESLLALEKNPQDRESLNSLFRVFHTIKGSAGMFGYEFLARFTHELEDFLSSLRDGEKNLAKETIALLFEAVDYIGELLRKEEMENPTVEMREKGESILKRLEKAFQVSKEENEWSIVIRPSRQILSHGLDPYSFVRYLKKLGQITKLKIDDTNLPSWEEFSPEEFYLNFQLNFVSAASQEEILSVFEFMVSEAELEVKKANNIRLRETGEELLPEINEGPMASKLTGSFLKEKKYLRLEAHKIDELVNLTGELVISAASVRKRSLACDSHALQEEVAHLARLIEMLRDNVMDIRMVPIGETFRRYERVVRDLSHELGKKIRLHLEGSQTELDKSLIENLVDPLMHLVRNAADHGIETPEERKQKGKEDVGTISLIAYHETGSVVIEVRDDGRGIDQEKVLQRAIELKLADPHRSYLPQEIYQFLFEPGFSTREEVSSVSGRGVGMDVVRSNIEALRGSVEIESEKGEGTVVRIRLPLTLAIIDGFLVQVAQSYYVIPLDMVQECFEFRKEFNGGGGFLNLRGEVLPYLHLRSYFNNGGETLRESVVVVHYGRKKLGLVVDKLLGEIQAVIKPLGRIFEGLAGLGGATILGEGEIAFILDIPKIIEMASVRRDLHQLGARL
ncbi:MAG: chemotaxis protein CheA [Leptospiraceae bacterium]|nr:chemotaxis protein CheA [Leptospiraceae bacterium]MDW8305795.1 chemotaxis protein CheA [Leptospiraceae bacterium]